MNKVWIYLIITVLIIICGIVLLLWKTEITIDNVYAGRVSYCKDGKIINIEIAYEDALKIAKLVSKHYYYRDSPSCGFSEETAIQLYTKEMTYSFYVAADGCPILYDPEKAQYIKLNNDELVDLHGILAIYGMKFPCI